MATIEHCLYCFEALAAHLEGRKPMSLPEIQKSFPEYVLTVEADDESNSEAATAATTTNTSPSISKLGKRLPALRRLAASSSSSSSSSVASSSTTSLSGSGADTPATSVSSTPATPPPAVTASPLFVTWNTLSPRHGRSLRGCIGTFETQELGYGLAAYALTSALEDDRFSPMSARELPSLEVAITLMTDFEDAKGGAMDWELGVHGLRISFHHHGRRYGATYLPDVAVEQGWTKEETVVSLMRKAGWMGRKDRWTDVDLKVVRYQGKVESLEYAEYRQWRDWVNKAEK